MLASFVAGCLPSVPARILENEKEMAPARPEAPGSKAWGQSVTEPSWTWAGRRARRRFCLGRSVRHRVCSRRHVRHRRHFADTPDWASARSIPLCLQHRRPRLQRSQCPRGTLIGQSPRRNPGIAPSGVAGAHGLDLADAQSGVVSKICGRCRTYAANRRDADATPQTEPPPSPPDQPSPTRSCDDWPQALLPGASGRAGAISSHF